MVSKWVKPTNDDAKLRKIFRIRTRINNVMKHKTRGTKYRRYASG